MDTTQSCSSPVLEDSNVQQNCSNQTSKIALSSDIATACDGSDKQYVKPEPVFTEEQIARSGRIKSSATKAEQMKHDLNTLGLIVGEIKAMVALVVPALTKINGVTWTGSGSMTSVGLHLSGPPASGKTEYADKLLFLLDAEPGYPNGKVTRILGSSAYGPLFGAGIDGNRFKHQILMYEELSSKQQAITEGLKMLITNGAWRHLSSGESKKTGRRQGQEYVLNGPLFPLLTTTESPDTWDAQFISRCVCIKFEPSETLRKEAFKRKVQRHGVISQQERMQIGKSWNHFYHTLKGLDPEDPEAFADIDMSALTQHFMQLADDLGDFDLRRLDISRMLIAGHCLVHQHQRQVRSVNGRDVLVAQKEDLNGIVDIFNQYVSIGTNCGNKTADGAFRQLVPYLKQSQSLTLKHMELHLNKGESSIRGYIAAWKKAGLIQKESTQGGEAHYVLGPAWHLACKGTGFVDDPENESAIVDRALKVGTRGFVLQPMN